MLAFILCAWIYISDINECATDADSCHITLATCTNTEGGYTCQCIPGYEGDGIVCSGEYPCFHIVM